MFGARLPSNDPANLPLQRPPKPLSLSLSLSLGRRLVALKSGRLAEGRLDWKWAESASKLGRRSSWWMEEAPARLVSSSASLIMLRTPIKIAIALAKVENPFTQAAPFGPTETQSKSWRPICSRGKRAARQPASRSAGKWLSIDNRYTVYTSWASRSPRPRHCLLLIVPLYWRISLG